MEMIQRLTPEVRKFVQVRQVLASAQALSFSLSDSLDSDQVGVIELERGGCILECDDRAPKTLREGEGLYDRVGISRQAELMRLVFSLEEVSTFRPFHSL